MMKRYLLLIFLILANLPMFALAIQTGEPVPACNARLENHDRSLDFGDYKGKIILVDFWATWCPPCKQSMPFLNQLRNELKDRNFEIIAINVDENSDDAIKYLASYPVDYPQAFDPEGNCPRLFDVKAMPSSYFIDRTGIVRAIHLGFRNTDRQFIREQIVNLISE